MLIGIDPAHGQHDPGTIGSTGLYEKDVVLSVSLKVGKLLQESGFEVVYTRVNDTPNFPKNQTENLRKRVQIANNAKADYFISIHCNGVLDRTAHGTETFIVGRGREAEKLATCVQNELIKATGLRDRGVKVANYLVLAETAMPAILVELAFISNPNEEKLLRDPAWLDKAARAIANGILACLGKEKQKEGDTMTEKVKCTIDIGGTKFPGYLEGDKSYFDEGVAVVDVVNAITPIVTWNEKTLTVKIDLGGNK